MTLFNTDQLIDRLTESHEQKIARYERRFGGEIPPQIRHKLLLQAMLIRKMADEHRMLLVDNRPDYCRV